MYYTITLSLTEEQEEQLSRITELYTDKTGKPTTSEKLLPFILSAGSYHLINDKLDFFETNLRKYCKT